MRNLPIGVIAIRTARLRSKSKFPTSAVGWCLREVRECYRVNQRDGSASEAWNNAGGRHAYNPRIHGTLEQFIRSIPRGAPVFWTGGNDGNGHIAIATGYRGLCFSTDIKRDGFFDKFPIADIAREWPALRLAGWAEIFNGQRVYPDAA